MKSNSILCFLCVIFLFGQYVENVHFPILYIEEFIFKIYTNIYKLFPIEKLIYQEFSAHCNFETTKACLIDILDFICSHALRTSIERENKY